MFSSFLEGVGFFLGDRATCGWCVLELAEVGDQSVKFVVVHLGDVNVQELMDWHVAEQVGGVGF